jgi:hypothetical protein
MGIELKISDRLTEVKSRIHQTSRWVNQGIVGALGIALVTSCASDKITSHRYSGFQNPQNTEVTVFCLNQYEDPNVSLRSLQNPGNFAFVQAISDSKARMLIHGTNSSFTEDGVRLNSLSFNADTTYVARIGASFQEGKRKYFHPQLSSLTFDEIEHKIPAVCFN